MKLAFVIHRYGSGIAGGSEEHCRQLAERLAASHDVTVLTTCAADYVTWRNVLPRGETSEGGVRVVRFPVAHPRDLKAFADISDEVFAGGSPPDRQDAWFRANGPDAPELLDHIRAHARDFDLVLFWAFRYSPSYFGVPLVADRAVLVPTAEADAAIDLEVLHQYFQLPAGYLFLTPEEQDLVCRRAGRRLEPSAVVGSGLEPAGAPPGRGDLDRLGLPPRFVLYLGRVDRNKGCQTLVEYFQEFVAEGGDVTLVLAGPATMRLPEHPRIRSLGYVSDEIRRALLAHARLLVLPSPYESLSMALLEAWNWGVPALVNGLCEVLAGQVLRAEGGLYYRSSREFSEGLSRLVLDDGLRNALGSQGRRYVDQEYRWPLVISRVERLLAEVRTRRARE